MIETLLPWHKTINQLINLIFVFTIGLNTGLFTKCSMYKLRQDWIKSEETLFKVCVCAAGVYAYIIS
jgi:hypothetical protein